MRFLFALMFWLFIPGLFMSWVDSINFAWEKGDAYVPFIAGIAAYFVIMGIRNHHFQHNFKWFRTFSHELTHAIFSLLTFNRIHGFSATAHSGGYVSFTGKSNMLITLSPYCIPIFTVFLLLVSFFIDIQNQAILLGGIGFTYMFHIHTFFMQAKAYQPDLKEYGLFTSYGFIIFFNLLFSGFVIRSAVEGLPGLKNFIIGAYQQIYPFVNQIFAAF